MSAASVGLECEERRAAVRVVHLEFQRGAGLSPKPQLHLQIDNPCLYHSTLAASGLDFAFASRCISQPALNEDDLPLAQPSRPARRAPFSPDERKPQHPPSSLHLSTLGR